jgi:hypothetical protein
MPFRYLKEGQVTPLLGGKQAIWTLVFALPPTARAAQQH